MAKLKFLIIHCTATPEGREVTSDEIRKWHTSPKEKGGRGWKQVGYADMVHISGEVENLVPYDEDGEVESWEVTNGATGMNSTSRHIVYVGGMDKVTKKSKDTRTAEQIESLKDYVQNVITLHPDIQIGGHGQVNATSCPGFDVPAWLKSIGIREKNIYRK